MNDDKYYMQLSNELGPMWYWVKDHHMFGMYPTFKNQKTKKILFRCDGRWLNKGLMKSYLNDCWRPSDQEGKDWFCTKMDDYFNN